MIYRIKRIYKKPVRPVKPTKKVRRKKLRKRSILLAAAVGCFFLIFLTAVFSKPDDKSALAPIPQLPAEETYGSNSSETEELPDETEPDLPEENASSDKSELFMPFVTDNTVMMDKEHVTARNALLADASSGEILGINMGLVKIYPASMTKVMTLLVASEHLDSSQMDDTYTMTYELLHPLIEEHASRVGFEEGETVTVKDMLYGLVLPSGADAAVGLCNYIAGSEENFAVLMNEKAEELGLVYTHFVNSSGLHDENHYTTCAEMAAIMKAAMDDPLCREILSTYTYTTSQTEQHPEGLEIFSDMFSRMYGTEVEGVVITAGKTGYTDEAGQCLVSYAEKNGSSYILVLGGDTGRYGTVYSTFFAYDNYLP